MSSAVSMLPWDMRVRRHDDVANFISGKLKTRQYQTVTEPRLPLGSSFRKPDLVVWDSAKSRASIIEIAVTSDNYPLSRTWQAKFDKYNRPEILEGVRELTDCQDVPVVPAVLSWRGCRSGSSARVSEETGTDPG